MDSPESNVIFLVCLTTIRYFGIGKKEKLPEAFFYPPRKGAAVGRHCHSGHTEVLKLSDLRLKTGTKGLLTGTNGDWAEVSWFLALVPMMATCAVRNQGAQGQGARESAWRQWESWGLKVWLCTYVLHTCKWQCLKMDLKTGKAPILGGTHAKKFFSNHPFHVCSNSSEHSLRPESGSRY